MIIKAYYNIIYIYLTNIVGILYFSLISIILNCLKLFIYLVFPFIKKTINIKPKYIKWNILGIKKNIQFITLVVGEKYMNFTGI